MGFFITYTVLCSKGNVRAKNQDNFWCMGKFLNCENDGLAEPIIGMIETKDLPAFAVFDGMGGEQHGEVAAHIAARSFDSAYKACPKNDTKKFLLGACAKMNEAICTLAEEMHIRSTGTTAAILMFGKKEVFICNIGDTRIYQFSTGKLTQITLDHCDSSVMGRKPPLSQNLGIPETEFVITPYLAKGVYGNKDRYLICSDGLTDMVSDKEIGEVILKNSSVSKSAEELLQRALNSGGNDNITVVVCEIRKHNRFSRNHTQRDCISAE